MTYTVFGFQTGTLDTVTLHWKILRVQEILDSLLRQIRTMYGYSVNAEGHALLEQRFNKQFANFVILDEVAIEACRTLRIPLGQEVGTVELEDTGTFAIPLFKWEYYTEVR